MKIYPSLKDDKNSSLKEAVDVITRERLNDINEWNNLPNRFFSGRKVGKVPSASTDVAITDRAGDINYDGSYLYICIDDSSTVLWKRATLGWST